VGIILEPSAYSAEAVAPVVIAIHVYTHARVHHCTAAG
jgi:hypothetical protein